MTLSTEPPPFGSTSRLGYEGLPFSADYHKSPVNQSVTRVVFICPYAPTRSVLWGRAPHGDAWGYSVCMGGVVATCQMPPPEPAQGSAVGSPGVGETMPRQ